MIFQPVTNEIIIGLFALATLAFSIFQIAKNKKNKALVWAWVRRAIILVLMALLLLRPGIGEIKKVDVYTNQYDVYFVVDTTASMIAEDWGDDKETRLTAVKQDIGRIVDEYSGARYALLTFDSSAIVRTPLTRDSSAVMSSVNILTPEVTKYSKGSSIDVASPLLESTLSRNMTAEPERARIVFFFTDGEQTNGTEPASYEASSSYISGGSVYGYGTLDGGPMKKQNGYTITSSDDEYIMDSSQEPPIVALSKIDEENLTTMAEQLGIEYSLRDANIPITIPELSEEKVAVSSSSGMKVTTDFTWIIALPLYGLLAFELGYILIFLTRFARNHNGGVK